MTNNEIKVYGKRIEELTVEELEHRLGFLKRQYYGYLPFLDAMRKEEAWVIETELSKRKGA